MSKVSLREEFLELLEKDAEFRYAVAGYLGLSEILKRLEEHDEKFNKILERLEKHDKKFDELLKSFKELLVRFDQLNKRVEVTIGSMGRRWGRDLENLVYELFKKSLEERGIDVGKVRKFTYTDLDGSVTGLPGRRIQVDVLLSDSEVVAIEVKSNTEEEDVDEFWMKKQYLQKVLGRPVTKALIVTVNISAEALRRARELGIDTVYGNVLE